MRRLSIILVTLLLLVGCAQRNNQTVDYQTNQNTLESLLIDDYLIEDMAYHQDKMIVLYTATREDIPTAKIVIVDSQSYEVINEISDSSYYMNCQIITLDDGFYINQSSATTVIYDYELNVLKEIPLESLSVDFSRQTNQLVLAFSNDLTQMVYVNFNQRSLIVRNLDNQEEKVIYQLSDDVGKMMDFDQVYFCGDYIAFAGKYIYAKDFEIAASNAYGRIHMDTLDIDFYEKNEVTAQFKDDYMLIIDVMRAQVNDNGTNESIIYDINHHTINKVKLDQSYNSFNLDFPSSDIVVSYNDIGRNTAKLILYQEGKNQVYDNAIPQDVLEVGSCYDDKNHLLIVYYWIPNGERVKGGIKGVTLS